MGDLLALNLPADTILAWYDEIVRVVANLTGGTETGAYHTSSFGTLARNIVRAVRGGKSALLTEAAQTLGTDEIVSNAAVLLFGGIETTEGMAAAAIMKLPGLRLSGHAVPRGLVFRKPPQLYATWEVSLACWDARSVSRAVGLHQGRAFLVTAGATVALVRNDVRGLQLEVRGLQLDVRGLRLDVRGLRLVLARDSCRAQSAARTGAHSVTGTGLLRRTHGRRSGGLPE
jgi:hypothetical protein